jgi:hypothetical protein
MGDATCSIPDCKKKIFGHGWCQMHYSRWRRNGDPLVSKYIRGGSDAERFWQHVDVAGVCWEWTGKPGDRGYGHFSLGTDKIVRAHKWAYESLVGKVAASLHLDHLCRNQMCVNPDHIQPVTPRINILRGTGEPARNARKTHCKWGHEFAGGNLRIDQLRDGKTRRVCRACERKRHNR